MASSFVNPIASVAGFKNQQLAPVTNRQGTPNPGTTFGRNAQETMDAGKPELGGLDVIRQRATRQHGLRLQAIAAQRAKQQPRVANMTGTGTYAYKGGAAGNPSSGNPKGLVGKYTLLPGADQALQGLNAAYRQAFGRDLSINSGGRTYAEQKRLYDGYKAGLKGYNLAAPPGTSEHESGRAIDFGGPTHNAGTREHNWLVANAGRFGFKWTGKNFKQFEAWHFEWWG